MYSKPSNGTPPKSETVAGAPSSSLEVTLKESAAQVQTDTTRPVEPIEPDFLLLFVFKARDATPQQYQHYIEQFVIPRLVLIDCSTVEGQQVVNLTKKCIEFVDDGDFDKAIALCQDKMLFDKYTAAIRQTTNVQSSVKRTLQMIDINQGAFIFYDDVNQVVQKRMGDYKALVKHSKRTLTEKNFIADELLTLEASESEGNSNDKVAHLKIEMEKLTEREKELDESSQIVKENLAVLLETLKQLNSPDLETSHDAMVDVSKMREDVSFLLE